MSLRDCGVTHSEEKSGTKVPVEQGQPEIAGGGEGGHSAHFLGGLKARKTD